MSFWTPILEGLLKVLLSFLVLLIIAKISRIELDRDSNVILFGLSIVLGYFLFEFTLALTVLLILCILVNSLRGRRKTERRFVPPEYSGRLDDDERE